MNREVDRGVVTSRALPYTPEQVFEAWSDATVIQKWWGPKGFSDTMLVFDFCVGGHWKHILVGPDGTGFNNLAIFTAIDAPRHLAFDHHMGFEITPVPHYTNSTDFAAHPDGMVLSMTMLFESQAEFDRIKQFILPLNEENFDKLEAVLGKMYGR